MSRLATPCAPKARAWALTGSMAAMAVLLSACAPTHDWRQTRSADGAVEALFPCKPQLHERRIGLVGGAVKMSLMACDAGGQTWGLASSELGDPARLGAVLDALAGAAAGNVAAAASAAALAVPGATPHPGSRRLRLDGRRPDGQPVRMQVALFTHGTRVYQASVLGERVSDELADTFFESLRVPP